MVGEVHLGLHDGSSDLLGLQSVREPARALLVRLDNNYTGNC